MGAGTMEQEKEYTIAEVAERLGISYTTARRRIVKQKIIRARREGLDYRVSETDLQAYIQSTYLDQQRGNVDDRK